MTDQLFGCPKCGNQVAYGTPICGNCGNDLTPYFSNKPFASARSFGPGAVTIAFVLLLLGGGILMLRGPAQELVDELQGSAEGVRDVAPEPDVFQAEEPVVLGYEGVRPLVRDLRAGGLPCSDIKIDVSDSVVESGSCQSRGTHVQINVYLEAQTLETAREIMEERTFDVVHADNWWVVTSKPIARKVARITGGRFLKASF